ncbi:protein kinase C delta type-like [Xenopus laevis]|uniref:Protein kinase C delta type-like n=1 Tax=Xenopus laevis TaxID=8355 RepID=A0A8J1L5Y1_XENLA|nr:protein kinase C delta type-like [Xenopus laevis]
MVSSSLGPGDDVTSHDIITCHETSTVGKRQLVRRHQRVRGEKRDQRNFREKMKRNHLDCCNSDPGPSQKKRRRPGSEKKEDGKTKKKRVRSLKSSVYQMRAAGRRKGEGRKMMKVKKWAYIEKYENVHGFGDAKTVTPAQSSRLDPLSVSSYDIFSMLGTGGFGKVMLAKLKDRKTYVALKYIRKKETDYNSIVTEAQVLKISSDCQFLCQGYATFQTQRHAFYVMEYLSGGSLEDELDNGWLERERVQFYSAEMICGLQFLHSKGIIHRSCNSFNLFITETSKPLNILLDHKGHARISDFGLAVQNVFKDDTITGEHGTLAYMAPEILQGVPYNAPVDWWSLGITICDLASGEALFYSDDRARLIEMITLDELIIPQWLDDDLIDLLEKLLTKNPRRRLGARGDIRCHQFYESIDWVVLEEQGAEPPLQPSEPAAKLFKPYEGKLSFLGSQEDKATAGDNNIISGFSFLRSSWLK